MNQAVTFHTWSANFSFTLQAADGAQVPTPPAAQPRQTLTTEHSHSTRLVWEQLTT